MKKKKQKKTKHKNIKKQKKGNFFDLIKNHLLKS